MCETMAVWETDAALAAQSDAAAEFARAWQSADKVVYSSTPAATSTGNTVLERSFDKRAVQVLKAGGGRDLIVGGPNLEAQALAAGLVDELRLIVWPVVLRGRNPALPTDMRADLELLDEHRVGSGGVYLRHRVRRTR
jgi:dihydrofolate reductase